MTIVEEVIDFIERKAAKEAFDWAKEKEIFDNKYPSTEDILRMKEKYYNAYMSHLKRWLDENL